jgi:hypothetical protein
MANSLRTLSAEPDSCRELLNDARAKLRAKLKPSREIENFLSEYASCVCCHGRVFATMNQGVNSHGRATLVTAEARNMGFLLGGANKQSVSRKSTTGPVARHGIGKVGGRR